MKTSPASKTPLLAAWMVLILASWLPTIILQEVFKQSVSPTERAVMSLGVILAGFFTTLIWKSLKGLRPYLIFFAVLIGTQWLVYNVIDRLGKYPQWTNSSNFNIYMLAEQSLNLIVTLVVIVTLLLLGKKRQEFYLAKGDLAAPAERVRWLGIPQGTPWTRVGAIASICISLGLLTFLLLNGRPSADMLVRLLPFLPAVLLAAALNSFNEEVTYKASFLSVLEGPVGPRQAVYMVAFYFGIAHYYGVPYGVIGVLMAAFMGWLLAKSMQETHGLFWAWFIHFLQDVWIFAFLALGRIVPGGG